jgi:hypothetical protein
MNRMDQFGALIWRLGSSTTSLRTAGSVILLTCVCMKRAISVSLAVPPAEVIDSIGGWHWNVTTGFQTG